VPGLRRRRRPASAVTIRVRTCYAALALENTRMPIELHKRPTALEMLLSRFAVLRVRFRIRLFRWASWLPRW
jgi:hypothetical protein